MPKQPTASIDSWEVLTEKLLQLYAHEMIKLCEASEYTAPEVSAECEQQRAAIRIKIIEIQDSRRSRSTIYKTCR